MKKNIYLLMPAFVACVSCFSQNFITEKRETLTFPIVSNSATSIYTDDKDDWLIQRTAILFQSDIEKVTGKKPIIVHQLRADKNIIIIGSIERSSILQQLIKEKKLNVDYLQAKWEAYQVQIIHKPFKGIGDALIIAGSDKRGTAYGVFELSKQIGVSPWYWWADVAVKKKDEVYITKNIFLQDHPLVKYRGIFINDEAPSFAGWAKEKFGGVNHHVYETIFELLLRLKANYMWPAMWGNAFNDDDTLNPVLADKYGIVMGTSHHEPMLRAQQEWKRYGRGKWNYDSNKVMLDQFWRKGIQNMGSHESIVTVGMRGDGDEPMTEGTAINLLERIVADQRKIIGDVTGRPAGKTPQLWALYKEVQEYYDKGMRVPDDVTLLLCDDNWGNLRKLPKLTDNPRSGGYGIYYHFDYVGDPRNYKWINTNNIARVWEQMHLAYEYGVDKIWIVNVGDLKPMEFPISFFLEYAWNPRKWNEDNLVNYYTQWATEQFGAKNAVEIGDILRKYSQYSARRKPELLSAETYNIHNYDEALRVTNEYNDLLSKAEKVTTELPLEYKDAFFELILHPVQATANLLQLYTAVAWNQYYASRRWEIANMQADKAKQLYIQDSLISFGYNRIANGKWNHMMDQTHIGYTYWQQPPENKMPEVTYVLKDLAEEQSSKVDVKKITAEDLIPQNVAGNIFYEQDGYISIQASHYTKSVNTSPVRWKIIPGVGRDGDGVTTFPVTAPGQASGTDRPHLEYEFYTYDATPIKIHAYFSPTLNFRNDNGLKYAVSVDDETPQIISINGDADNKKIWEQWVAENIIVKISGHNVLKTGRHVLKYWMISSAVILQKLVIDFGGLKPSYLGPPETKMNLRNKQ